MGIKTLPWVINTLREFKMIGANYRVYLLGSPESGSIISGEDVNGHKVAIHSFVDGPSRKWIRYEFKDWESLNSFCEELVDRLGNSKSKEFSRSLRDRREVVKMTGSHIQSPLGAV